jgi:hypothetical protein
VAEWSRMLDTGLSKVLEVTGNLKDEVGGYWRAWVCLLSELLDNLKFLAVFLI